MKLADFEVKGVYVDLIAELKARGFLKEDGDTLLQSIRVTRISAEGSDPRTDKALWLVTVK